MGVCQYLPDRLRNNDNGSVSVFAAACTSTEDIQKRIAPLQMELANHSLYRSIQSLAHLRLFMESHVFAVWDFMSLLKSLQSSLTSVRVPWVPTGHPTSRRFINEIVPGEESDEYDGRPVSHFEVYLEAMQRAGAKTAVIESRPACSQLPNLR